MSYTRWRISAGSFWKGKTPTWTGDLLGMLRISLQAVMMDMQWFPSRGLFFMISALYIWGGVLADVELK